MPTHSSDRELSWPRFNTSLSQTPFNRQQPLESLRKTQRERERKGEGGGREPIRAFLCITFTRLLKGSQAEVTVYILVKSPTALEKLNPATLLPS